ncbi:E3 ubiquitin-protein ligase XBAT35 [Artemisia annua]|uniref:E3 ubiquitin-protein ligase XBAT35 n=1 Tax=Artemisia annua TaxID=35608 RepID=A0A2U1KW70_ARTAN|nr:E3 ubiquitin-protein ligase XBAT35 [Artemisia annua]
MGLQHSKGKLLYQQARSGNSEGIKALRNEGASLEWTDIKGRTPLMVASMNLQLYDVAKTLIELGADVNSLTVGFSPGTPLHFAAKRGLEQMVKLLLLNGANALVMNVNDQTALDLATDKGHSNVVRAIENHICLFSGWMQELYGPGLLLSRNVWVVILPRGSRTLTKAYNLELDIYSSAQDARPRRIIPLWKANTHEPNFNRPVPVVIINSPYGDPIILAAVNENEKQQLQQFLNACQGIPQVMHHSFPFNNQGPNVGPAAHTKIAEDPADLSETIPAATTGQKEKKDGDSSSCVICSDAPVEGAFIPCGHMAGCMSCLTEIKGKNSGCPVCRASIDQVIRLYVV